MTFDLDQVIKVLTFTMSAGAVVVSILMGRRKQVEERFKIVEAKVDDLEKRLHSVEHTVQQLPGREDIHSLAMSMSEMNGELKAIRAHMRSVTDTVGRVEDVLQRHEDHLRENN